jgi:MFS family permease
MAAVITKPLPNPAGGAFSLGTLLSTLAAPFLGRLMDRYGPRGIIASDAVIVAGGFLLAVLTATPAHLYLTFGLACERGERCTLAASMVRNLGGIESSTLCLGAATQAQKLPNPLRGKRQHSSFDWSRIRPSLAAEAN